MNYSSLYRTTTTTTTTTTTVAKHKVTQHVRQDTNEYVIKKSCLEKYVIQGYITIITGRNQSADKKRR